MIIGTPIGEQPIPSDVPYQFIFGGLGSGNEGVLQGLNDILKNQVVEVSSSILLDNKNLGFQSMKWERGLNDREQGVTMVDPLFLLKADLITFSNNLGGSSFANLLALKDVLPNSRVVGFANHTMRAIFNFQDLSPDGIGVLANPPS